MGLSKRSLTVVVVVIVAGIAFVITAVRGRTADQLASALPGYLSAAGGAVMAILRSDKASRRVDEIHGLVEKRDVAVRQVLAEHDVRAGAEVARILAHPDRPEFAELIPADCPRGALPRSCCIFDRRRERCPVAIREGIPPNDPH